MKKAKVAYIMLTAQLVIIQPINWLMTSEIMAVSSTFVLWIDGVIEQVKYLRYIAIIIKEGK